MLTTQVQYWTLKETEKHNRASEDLGYKNLNESIRHNVVTEEETYRHNVATESEQQRHNLATESYYTNSLNETVRHNIVNESLQGEANFIAQRNAAANEMNAYSNRMNAYTNAMNAQTSRFSAITGYSLGLDANRIANVNAEANKQNAETREYESRTHALDTLLGSRSTDAQVTNSHANIMNAETRQGELDLGYENLNLNQERFNWQKFTDSADIINETSRTQTQNVKDVVNMTSNILDALTK